MSGRVGRAVMAALRVLPGIAVLGWIAALGFYQLASPWRGAFVAVVSAVALAYFYATWRGYRTWPAKIAVLAFAAIWWVSLQPRADRDWKPEVAHGVTAEIAPGRVALHNVRNFGWTSETEAVERWEDRVVDPDAVTSVDVILSVWDDPDIAHTLVSFGFADGQHVVFSAEIRKERDEEYSTFGGFFRKFELVLIAADERDIVRLRTDMRGEQVSLYPITLTPEQRKTLFLSFVDLGNAYEARPRWYNTVTANCTTIPYRLAARLSDRVVLDPRVILSGRLPSYLRDLGVIRPDLTDAEIAARAPLPKLGDAGAEGAAFSRRLRAGWAD